MIRFVTGLCTPPAIARGSIFRVLALSVLALLVTAGAQAATVNLTITASAPLSTTGTTYVFTGQAAMSGVYAGNAAFTATVSLTSTPTLPNYTITVSTGNTLTGIFIMPIGALSGTVSNGSLTITGGTGTYNTYSGTFSSLSETGSIGTSGITLSASGTGTVSTAGGGTTTPVPTILSVTDGASYTANISEGAFFTVWGSNLAPSNLGLTNFPRP
jgi:hypothetical protein